MRFNLNKLLGGNNKTPELTDADKKGLGFEMDILMTPGAEKGEINKSLDRLMLILNKKYPDGIPGNVMRAVLANMVNRVPKGKESASASTTEEVAVNVKESVEAALLKKYETMPANEFVRAFGAEYLKFIQSIKELINDGAFDGLSLDGYTDKNEILGKIKTAFEKTELATIQKEFSKINKGPENKLFPDLSLDSANFHKWAGALFEGKDNDEKLEWFVNRFKAESRNNMQVASPISRLTAFHTKLSGNRGILSAESLLKNEEGADTEYRESAEKFIHTLSPKVAKSSALRSQLGLPLSA